MTKQELLAILLRDDRDPEGHHADCDDALLAFINDEEVTVAFHSATKWYA
jgi:hypothetical protein